MDRLLESVKDSASYESFVNTEEGKNIINRIVQIVDEINVLPDDEKLKFEHKIGKKINETLIQLKYPEKSEFSELVTYSLNRTVCYCFVFIVVGVVLLYKILSYNKKKINKTHTKLKKISHQRKIKQS
ncbi:CLUMA_CG021315, isoform A [Clunio marinus]|uniref:CLUMA_CG021315, isoform A n=1 Tax=Clunio marinus TaxID=568069 RepID=A0A1J1JAY6_9DIPT|nr:CLUMA_CG021315, isoform A [Clunio marinus]